MPEPSDERFRAVLRWILAAIYIAAGLAHLWVPEKLLAITPSWVPFAPTVILATGICEIAGAVALVAGPLRRWAGIGLAAYAICVWPANFKHAIDGIELPYISNSWLYHGPRLAFQPVLIWWALYCAGVIDWPWRKAK
ncbi:hypothetical protein CWS35_14690 [Bradyrhizobium sp. SK17]|uniref:DoxX family protein n=1 Tax=Bradyrhizobium sp. SK17 TaxID=2057741 RepID=UPI000C302119|nr:DoxX family protein [Bradyrhizobium sp. SK17]AUC95349.1 hypothetical protein CWS35_14690 [Bradyrhizobium sp. SK17]